MKNLITILFLLGSQVFAAEPPKHCQVIQANLKTGTKSVIGNFEATVGEEELTTKTYVVKNLKKVVTARVYFTDEWVGIKWGDGVSDVSTTVRLDIEDRAMTGGFEAKGPNTQTRVLFSNWGDIKALDVCKKALADKSYASSIAEGGNLPILLDSCEAYVENKESNTMLVSKTVKGQEIRLVCSDQE